MTGGTAKMTGGTVSTTSTSNSAVAVFGGTFSMSAGSITASNVEEGGVAINNTGGSVSVTGGTITSAGIGIIGLKGTIAISGGTISAVSYGIHMAPSSGNVTFSMSGGTVSASGCENSVYCTGIYISNETSYAVSATITKGDIYGDGYGIHNKDADSKIVVNTTSASTVRIEASNSSAVMVSAGTVTLGSTTTALSSSCGINVKAASASGYAATSTGGVLNWGCTAYGYAGRYAITIGESGTVNLTNGRLYINTSAGSAFYNEGTRNLTGSWETIDSSGTYSGFKVSVPYVQYSYRYS